MESILDTPAKRRKLEDGQTAKSQAYDSQDDSGDDIFDDYETIATVPVPIGPVQNTDAVGIISSPPIHVTQPTQIINKAKTNVDSTPVVQVAASSPARAANAVSPTPREFARSMAPAGTMFRPPLGITKAEGLSIPKRSSVIDLSSDDNMPLYKGGSSDDDSQANRRADIKPSTFIISAQRSMDPERTKAGAKGFGEIISSSFYRPVGKGGGTSRALPLSGSRLPTSERSADVMANAYGRTRRPSAKQQSKQTISAKALAVPEVESLDAIVDNSVRKKVERIMSILPGHSVDGVLNALKSRKYHTDDAMELLVSEENDRLKGGIIALSDEDPLSVSIAPKKAPAKQQVKAPVKNIVDKWAGTQTLPKTIQPSSLSAVKSSRIAATSKPRRRLVQGRKQPSSPVTASTPVKQAALQAPIKVSSSSDTAPDSRDSDSGVDLSKSEGAPLEKNVLNFFNTCTAAELADIAAISTGIATSLLSQKPFTSLTQVRQIPGEVPSKNAKKGPTRKPMGDKIVEKCLEMWTGYEAVDDLVRQCERLGNPVKEEMKKWGVDVFGATLGGELELARFDPSISPRDSGIGTPTSINVSDEEDSGSPTKDKKLSFFAQPSIMAQGIQLKDYQLVGINWLALLFKRELSCILADDMGLGKTCQVIAFLAHLLETGIKGPHLVIVPSSTLENWLREFSIFCPQLLVMPYYGSQNERPSVQDQILARLDDVNVIVTTYPMAKPKDDNRFLRKLKPLVCVYDEGHLLKNSKSAGYGALMRIQSRFRLLLTGTPLQNNLRELASLLGFILPSVFDEHSDELEAIFSHKAKTTSDSHAALLSDQRIARAKSMMTPFILRRKKHQVLKHLPAKKRRIEYCDLSPSQATLYERETAKALRVIAAKAAGEKTGSETSNVMMALRKASIHPLLFRRLYDDKAIAKMAKACLQEEEFRESNVDFIYQDMELMTDMELYRFCEKHPCTMANFSFKGDEWMDSGKVERLAALLKRFKGDGDRVLIFSQFTMVMDILEAVMETLEMSFFRLDGSTSVNERQDMIDQFHQEKDITVFLLSTKAGGAGINLACANKVIIFDSSFNPQDDVQAENRAHRVGQTREVEVVRLVTRNTIEEQILALGETKLVLDDRVAGAVDGGETDAKAEKQGAKMVEDMVFQKLQEETVLDVAK